MFPTPKALHTAYVLSFITTHELSDIEPVIGADHINVIKHDPTGIINLNPETQTFTIQLPGDRNVSTWTHVNPGTVFKRLINAPGTLYLAAQGSIPSGENQFWIQQYPDQPGEEVGRTVIEFYTNNLITAVFKTDVDNFGGSGTGNWTSTPRK